MSIFQRHLSAALAARSIAPISAAADPLTDVATESVVAEEELTAESEIVAEAGDAFAEQRAALNFNNGTIRNRLAQGEDESEEEVPAKDESSELDIESEDMGQEELEVPGGDNIGEDVVEVDENSLPVVDGDQVTDVSDSGDVDFENEAEEEDEFGPEADDMVEDAVRDDAEIEALAMEIDMLDSSAVAIEQFGMNPTAMAIMQTTGLLNGTALESIGLESCNYVDGKHDESLVALEALGEKIKETAAKWAGKILGFAKKIKDGVVVVLEKIWEKISSAVSALSSAVWDKTKAAAAVVKAHPYKTILAVIATIGAVAGVITLFGGMPAVTAGAAAMRTWFGGIVTKLNGAVAKFPFASIKSSLNAAGTKIVTTVRGAGSAVSGGVSKAAGAVKGASVSALGWSQTAVKSAGGQLKTAYNAALSGSKALGTRVTKLGTAAGSAVKDKAVAGFGAAKGGLASSWGYISSLAVTALTYIRQVIFKGLAAIKSTFTSLMGVFKGGKVAAAAAA